MKRNIADKLIKLYLWLLTKLGFTTYLHKIDAENKALPAIISVTAEELDELCIVNYADYVAGLEQANDRLNRLNMTAEEFMKAEYFVKLHKEDCGCNNADYSSAEAYYRAKLEGRI